MPVALKCAISVQAGIIVDEPMAEHTRVWNLDNTVIEACEENPKDCRYIDAVGAAMNYAAQLQNPGRVNWVRFEWIWM